MSFEQRTKKRLESLRDSVVQFINHEIEYGTDLFRLMDDDDWDEVYAGLDIHIYFEVRDGQLGVDVSYGPNKTDNKFFPMEAEIKFTAEGAEYPREDFDLMADEFERFAKILRNPVHAF